MVVIRRYSNRKLYDTDSKRYISLAEISEKISQGEEIQVIDHRSGEDITTVTLLLIVLSKQREQSGCLDKALLYSLVRNQDSQQEYDNNSEQNATLSGSKGTKQFHRILSTILESSDNQGDCKLQSPSDQVKYLSTLQNERWLELQIESCIEKRYIPSRQDIQRLNEQLSEISLKLFDKNLDWYLTD